MADTRVGESGCAVTYKLDTVRHRERFVMLFQGTLDAAALSEIRAEANQPVLRGERVRLVLLARTEVEGSCIRELGWLQGVEVVAQDAYLRRWLASCD